MGRSLLDTVTDLPGKQFRKVYLAQDACGEYRGRSGHLLSGVYRPRGQQETDSFSGLDNVFANEAPPRDFDELVDV